MVSLRVSFSIIFLKLRSHPGIPMGEIPWEIISLYTRPVFLCLLCSIMWKTWIFYIQCVLFFHHSSIAFLESHCWSRGSSNLICNRSLRWSCFRLALLSVFRILRWRSTVLFDKGIVKTNSTKASMLYHQVSGIFSTTLLCKSW